MPPVWLGVVAVRVKNRAKARVFALFFVVILVSSWFEIGSSICIVNDALIP